LVWPELKGGLAFYGILVSILDVAIFDPWHQRLRRMAAIVQEAFDCSVLQLSWDDMRVGSPPEEEDVHDASSAYLGGRDDPTLKDWYPVAAGELPVALGRIICQRANLRWDATLRRRYRMRLAEVLLALGIIICVIGLRPGFSLEQLTLGVLAPIAPMVLWGIREFRLHGDAAAISDRLREKSSALWSAAIARRVSEEQLAFQSRQLQSEIYNRRSTAPMIAGWIYRHMRASGEEQMNVAANELVREAKAKGF
jgi:hypothetical protein